LEGFIDEFFDQNPISQMGIIIMKNKRAEKISELAGNPRKHIKVREVCHFSEKCHVICHDGLQCTLPALYLLPWQSMMFTIYPLPYAMAVAGICCSPFTSCHDSQWCPL
jgi:hypothetical protein